MRSESGEWRLSISWVFQNRTCFLPLTQPHLSHLDHSTLSISLQHLHVMPRDDRSPPLRSRDRRAYSPEPASSRERRARRNSHEDRHDRDRSPRYRRTRDSSRERDRDRCHRKEDHTSHRRHRSPVETSRDESRRTRAKRARGRGESESEDGFLDIRKLGAREIGEDDYLWVHLVCGSRAACSAITSPMTLS